MKSTIEEALKKQQQDKTRTNDTRTSETDTKSPVVSDDIITKTGATTPEKSRNKVPQAETISTKSPSAKPFEIDLEHLAENGHVSLDGERRQINEEYREIKRKLLANAFGPLSKTLKNPNIIMVTSSRPSEGKTFTATNLALSIAAERDKTVLLIDADVLKPNVLKTLALESRKGLMEYLVGDIDDISDVLYHTSIDKLKIIPAGKSHHLSTEMLASQKMLETVDEFANRYPDRIVIIDTPPLIGINESAILANFAGQAVVVVEEGRAKLSDIKLSVERLNPDMAIGFVVNKSIHHDADHSGYYGYYYAERS